MRWWDGLLGSVAPVRPGPATSAPGNPARAGSGCGTVVIAPLARNCGSETTSARSSQMIERERERERSRERDRDRDRERDRERESERERKREKEGGAYTHGSRTQARTYTHVTATHGTHTRAHIATHKHMTHTTHALPHSHTRIHNARARTHAHANTHIAIT